jgi:integrase
MSVDTLRAELHRAATDAGLKSVTPHQLRHTYVICTAKGRMSYVSSVA